MAAQLPARLQVASPFPFVGRARELATLRGLLPLLPEDKLRIGLLAGEAGSGKSRLVRELVREVAGGELLVLSGATDPVVRPPFGPFVEAISQLVRAVGVEGLRGELGPTGGELIRLLPDLGVEGSKAAAEADPDTGRHRLHTAVGDLLVNVTRRRPVLLVLEDLHWADGSTQLLLRHLARTAGEARMLILATFRDTGDEVPAELADLLADLRRAEHTVRLKLGGLGEESVAEFVSLSVEAASPGDLPPGADPVLVRSLFGLTEGSPFLLCELWRTLNETGAVAVDGGLVRLTQQPGTIGTPESVREVVQQRLARLEPAATDVLDLAAVIGGEFDFDTLRDAAAPELDLSAGLAGALRSGMIDEVPAPALAFRFAHELVRQAVYERLNRLRRAELHLQVARALERRTEQPNGQLLAGLAHHYTAAVPVGAREQAIAYNRQAARAAADATAFGEAVLRLRSAIELETSAGPRLVELQIELGAELCRAGNYLDSLTVYREAAAQARRSRNPELLARAAIGFENACTRPGIYDQGAVALLDEASELLPTDDSPLRIRLLGSLAMALNRLHGDDTRGRRAREAGIAMARRLDDRAALATILTQSYWSDLDRRIVLGMLREARDLAAELGQVDLEAEAIAWQIASLLALGDTAAAEAELATVLEMVARIRQPFHSHVAEHDASALALFSGRLEEARAAAERSREWGQLLSGRDASSVYGIQMFGILREQGRLADLAPMLRKLAGLDQAWQPGLAALLAEVGMDNDARDLLARIRRAGLAQFRQSLWLLALTYLADASSAVGEAGVARLVYPELLPLAGAPVVVGHGIACYGAADRYLGMLAATFGDLDAAERHFEAALRLNRRMGARTWLAHTAYQYGRLLARRGQRARGEALFGEAKVVAESAGLTALLNRLGTSGGDVHANTQLPDGLSAREADVLRLLADGLTNRQIAGVLHISEHTAANHVRSILGKTGTANRTEAAAYAFRRGLAASPTSG